MFQQMFNMFICKARLGLPFGRFMFANKWNFIGLFVGALFTMAIVYVPPLNSAFGTSHTLTPIVWLFPIAGGVLLLLYSTVRTIVIRSRNPIKYSQDIDGLQMHSTIWTDQHHNA
jgi:sodium/potassium-transporting ATPase subunit alpha